MVSLDEMNHYKMVRIKITKNGEFDFTGCRIQKNTHLKSEEAIFKT